MYYLTKLFIIMAFDPLELEYSISDAAELSYNYSVNWFWSLLRQGIAFLILLHKLHAFYQQY